MTQSRQLAAIMFIDIVGYTVLMGEDEQRRLRPLRRTGGYKNRSLKSTMVGVIICN